MGQMVAQKRVTSGVKPDTVEDILVVLLEVNGAKWYTVRVIICTMWDGVGWMIAMFVFSCCCIIYLLYLSTLSCLFWQQANTERIFFFSTSSGHMCSSF